MVRGAKQRQRLNKQAASVYQRAQGRSRKPPEVNEDMIDSLVEAVPEATPAQARRALNKARRVRTGEPRSHSGSKPTYSVVANDVELKKVAVYAERHRAPKAVVFHDGLAMLTWLDRHDLVPNVLNLVKRGATPEEVVAALVGRQPC